MIKALVCLIVAVYAAAMVGVCNLVAVVANWNGLASLGVLFTLLPLGTYLLVKALDKVQA